MSYLSKARLTDSRTLLGIIITGCLVAVGVVLWLSPSSGAPNQQASDVAQGIPVTTRTATAPGVTSTVTSRAAASSAAAKAAAKARTTTRTAVATDVIRPPRATDVVVVKDHHTRYEVIHGPTHTSTVTHSASAPPGKVQTEVITQAAGRTITVKVPPKSQLISPKKKYYGLAEEGLPASGSRFDTLDRQAGKAPNLVEWFAYWDDSYSPLKVTQAWSRDALPVITWQSAPHDFSNTSRDITSYSLHNIAIGNFDHYLNAFASSVVNTRLPVVIRLDQEMNGNWYPWSAGYMHRGIHNQPADFVAAWRHIWQLFQDAGANKYVIWAWTPSRTNTLIPGSTTPYTDGDTGLQEDYPGDPYVDWIGMSAYQFRPAEPATYQWIFGGTLTGNDRDIGLKQISSKPIFVAEMGSAQVVGGNTDNTATKVTWTRTTLRNFANDPQIIGFVLFNNNVIGLHHLKMPDGTNLKVDTNWQFASSQPALAAFRQSVANPTYGSGIMPHADDVTVRVEPPPSAAN